MASLGRRLMVYLGLSDDEYDEYDEPEHEAVAPPPQRPAVRAVSAAGDQRDMSMSGGPIRTLTREEQPSHQPAGGASAVRPVTQEKSVVHVVAPSQFADAQEIADRIRSSQPVIVNLQFADRELARRMIDFCSGVTYALGGRMEKVAEQVFLLTPSNVQVSAEERQRLSERGLFQQ